MERRPPRRRRWLILKALVSLGLLGWLGQRMLAKDGVDALLEALDELALGGLLAAVGLHLLAVLLGVARWRVLLREAGVRRSFGWLLASYLKGRFVGAFTPSITGLDGWRLYELGRAEGDLVGAGAVLAMEKLVGLLGMALVCAALVPLGGAALLGDGAVGAALAIGAGAALGVVALRDPRWLAALARRAPGPARGRLERVLDSVRRTRPRGPALLRALLCSVGAHLALSAVFAATAAAVGVTVGLGPLLLVGNAICLAVLLPVSVGGVGVREGVAVALLGALSVSTTDAVLVALLGYLTGQIPALLGGALMLGARPARAPSVEAPAH